MRRPLLVTIAVGLVLSVSPALAAPPSPSASTAAAAGARPFVLQSTRLAASTSHLVFAHYFPPYPISLDNQAPAHDYYARNYLLPGGEDGKHVAYGGLLRDRPLPRAPRSGDWQLADMETDVRNARAAGIDGFSVDVLSLQPSDATWQRTVLLLRAAHLVDPTFRVMLMPDMTAGPSTASPAELAAGVAQLAAYPAAFHLGDGRLVLSPYKPEVHAAVWWSQVLGLLSDSYGIPVAFVPTFANELPFVDAFAPISYGMSSWGSRNPANNDPSLRGSTSAQNRIAAVHARGLLWMQPVSIQDERPRSGVFQEAANTKNLRSTWQIARQGHADWVQLTTWNDYSEGTQFAPSARSGWSFLDIDAYYLQWWKLGKAPKVVQDVVYLTNRGQLLGATPTSPETRLMSLLQGTPGRNTVEALVFLRERGAVTVVSGSHRHTCTVPAGVSTCTVALGVGKASASTSSGVRVTSTQRVVAHPLVQDLSYVATSSGRLALGASKNPLR